MTAGTWWWRIGGPNAVTVWSWWVSLPLALLASVYGGALAGLPLVPWVLAALVANVVLIVPLVIVRATYLSSRPRPSRPVLAVVTFAMLGALRSLIMAGVAASMGYTDMATILWEWPLMGAIGAVFALSVIAVVVDSVRDHRAATERLLALQASLRQINEIESARLVDLEAGFISDVEEQILAALARVRSSQPATGREAGRSLREVADAVVRPLSHALASAEPWQAPAPTSSPSRRSRNLGDLVRLIQPVHPLGPVLVFEAAVLPFMLARFGLALALLNLLIGSLILVGLGSVVLGSWRAAGNPWVNVAGLVIAYAATFVIAAAVVVFIFQLLDGQSMPFWSGAVVYPLLVLAWALLDALLARRVELEEELAVSLAGEAQAAERLRSRVVSMRQRIAKTLHSVVQGELVTSALSLSRTEDPAAVISEVDRVTASIAQRLRAEEPVVSSRDQIHELLSLWSTALAVETDVDPDLWAELDTDPDLREAVIDVLAEGLTNAVRHGSGPSVQVVMSMTSLGVDVAILSQGHLRQHAQSGLGMQTIASSAQSWALEERAGVVHLSVSLVS